MNFFFFYFGLTGNGIKSFFFSILVYYLSLHIQQVLQITDSLFPFRFLSIDLISPLITLSRVYYQKKKKKR